MALNKIGPYEFQGILGRGGMGSVYRGVHVETGEIHAVKILAPTYANDPHFRGRFESEIKSLLKLNHPNTVKLLSFGQEDGMLYFSMELVEGNSLFQLQRKGHRFDWRQTLGIALDVANGLRHAHDRGIIHRDLKPGNLLMPLNEDGTHGNVKITDFGIAKRFGTSQNTGTNVVGTMDFMSPEQAKGEAVTIRSDLYSLGAVLFTLLSGRPPFSANSIEESLRNITKVPPPKISSVVPDVPKELEELIRKLMAKKPETRIQTTVALIHKLNEVGSYLKGYSEAKTAYTGPGGQSGQMDETFEVNSPQTVENTVNEGNASVPSRNKTSDELGVTADFSQTDGELTLAPATDVDFYNPVDDQIRRQLTEYPVKEESGSIGTVLLALALMAVLALGGYLVYRAYLPPASEALLAKIELYVEEPNKAQKEIDLFLKYYPDTPEAERVSELKKIADAIQLYNTLSRKLKFRQGVPGEKRLSSIQQEFLELLILAEEDPVEADRKMGAFITVHGVSPDLTIADQECVDAAKSYRRKIKYDADNRIQFRVKQIRSAMDQANQITDPDGAIPIYESIVKLYGDTDWGVGADADAGRALVVKARNVLISMRKAKIDAEQKAKLDAVRDKEEKEADETPETGKNQG
ncbi:MAG: serine/threonine-protein kinase [Planctomycetota bacterium]